MQLTVYLAGEIHSDWRNEVKQLAQAQNLAVEFVGPQEDHDRSDAIGETVKGSQPNAVYRDQAASEMNNLRTRVLLGKSDLVIALFGEKYRQWNTAMDAATAITLDKPLILIRAESLHHPLKEISQKAQTVVETVEQAVQALAYILE